ncbi:hypothetical protein H7I40_02245 [Mycolicibacterium madagascariense]|nr:hypothetical protein [Mycolicibacterium madagascariense]
MVDHQSDPTPRATVVMIIDAGVGINRGRLRYEVEHLHYLPNPAGEPIHQSFISEERLHTTSWGAAGAGLELLVWAAATGAGGIIGGAAWDGLKAIALRIRNMHGLAFDSQPLNGQDAQHRALQMARAAWPDLGEPLTALSCHLDGDTATVALRAPDGSTFKAQPTMTASDAIGPIIRAYPDPPAQTGQS